MDAPETDAPRSPGRRLTLPYVLALSTVALLSLGAQRLIQRQLDNGQSDSRVINVAGRQRMLSQRLAKDALRVRLSEGEQEQVARAELSETLRHWVASHEGLRNGDTELGLPAARSQPVDELYAEVEPHFAAMRRAAEQLLAQPTDSAPAREAIDAIARNEAQFLAGMDAIVSQYVAEAETRVLVLRRLELAILGTTLLVLLLEGLFIFRPAVAQIERSIQRLESVGAAMRDARDEAQRANAVKTRFLANVSHELRTPMTAVLGMTELTRNTDEPKEREEYLSVVEEAGESLLSLLNDLIDIARIDADRIDLNERPFDPTELVSRTARLMRPAADAKGIDLRVEPSDDQAPVVWGDEKRLGQVLLNLAGNAIKWTDEGSVALGCHTQAASESHVALCLTVADTGVGIAAEEQERIFEPFAQVTDGAAPQRGGAGLGLSICRRIVDAMQGEIFLSSQPGVGTTVRVECELPLATAPITPDPVRHPATAGPGVLVLVIDDSGPNRTTLRRMLEEAGHTVEACADGASGLAAFENGGHRVVLTDFRLPDLDGVAVARRIRSFTADRGRAAPGIACITAHTGEGGPTREEAFFDEVLLKPVRRDTLLETVAKLSRGEPRTRSPVEEDRRPTVEQELAEAFCVAAPSRLAHLKSALNSGDWRAVALVAHGFAEQLVYFDADPLPGQLRELEMACAAGESERCARLGGEVARDLAHLIHRLEQSL